MHNNATHIRMDSSEDDYRQKLMAAKAQSGMFEIMNEGAAGAFTKNSKDPKYGVPRLAYGEVAQGRRGGFAQGDGEVQLGQPYNAPMTRNAQTGNLQTGMDSTNEPQMNPEFFAAPAERMQRVAMGQQGFDGYNDRNRRA